MIYRSSSGIRVEDLSSKYGVYVNNGIDTNKPIGAKTLVDLKAGNIVRFGRLENIFRLENIEINVITSTVPPEDSKKLKKVLEVIDGKLLDAFSTECTHLIMTTITITVKVLQSLAYGLPIVTPSYFDAYLKSAMEHSVVLPDVKDYIPGITEPFIMKEIGMMEVHLDRKRLFQNKTFIFMVKKHMDKYESIIKLAGGNCINMEMDSVKKSSFLKPGYIPVHYESSANSQCSSDIGGIMKYIEKHGRRMVIETEIGLAIIHRQMDRFCNPDRKMVEDFRPISIDSKDILKSVIIGETPHSSNTMKPALQSMVIPETIEVPDTETNNNLRGSEAIDLDKPSNLRRSTRSSLNAAKNDAPIVVEKIPTPKKNQKRKADSDKKNDSIEMDVTDEVVAPQKKQKTNDEAENKGENICDVFVEPFATQSQNVHNFSGFNSTQRHKKLKSGDIQSQSQSNQPEPTPGSSKMGRKRILGAIKDDSDEEENGKDEKNSFNFGRKSKRAKVTSTESNIRNMNQSSFKTIDDDDDDDESGTFNFSKNSKSKSQTKQKPSQLVKNEEAGIDASDSNESDKKTERKHKPYGRPPIVVELSDHPIKKENKWIMTNIKRELKFKNDEPNPESSSVQIKEENSADSDIKFQWIKSMANVFIARKIAINTSRRSMADETDSICADLGNETHNKSVNIKTFKKVI